MKAKAAFWAVVAVLCVAALGLLAAGEAGKPAAPRKAGTAKNLDVASLEISGPFTHQNLAIFLLRGKDRVEGKKFVTLQEALKRKTVVIYETGSVSKLTIENTGDVTVYIQSGEVVKGGKQDRMLQYDYIVPPKSGKQPISSFCVERGRWRRRGGESAGVFAASSNAVPGNAMRLAAKLKGNQGAVWSEVAKTQTKLSSNVGESVQSGKSASSLQLSMENKKLKEMAEAYKKALAGIVRKHNDVLGFAVAVNGEVNNVDVYASNSLFARLWPKLLETSAFEAIAELKKDAKFDQPKAEDVRKFVAEVDKARAREKRISKRLKMVVRETDAAASFETRGKDDTEIHRSYHKKQQ